MYFYLTNIIHNKKKKRNLFLELLIILFFIFEFSEVYQRILKIYSFNPKS